MSVFKLRRPKSQWASAEVPEFYETYYMKLHGPDGKQVLRNTHATDKALAGKIEAAARRKIREESWQGLLDALEPTKARRTLATLGDIETAYLLEGVQIVKQDKAARDNVASLFRVVAWAQGLWTAAGEGMKGIKPGTRVHDAARIRKLSSGVLTGELVRAYFRERQGGKELDVSSRKAENRSINSTLNHARQVFSKRARAYKLGKLQLPDLDGFMQEPMLPAAESEAQPLTGPEWDAMVKAAGKLADRELALVNQLLRVTGMRSAELVALHESWLVQEGKGWAIEIRDRKEKRAKPEEGEKEGKVLLPGFSQKGVKNRKVPVPVDLVATLRSRKGFLIGPKMTMTDRSDLVNRTHNAWLKGMIGGLGEKTQGNHRLRDTVCSALWSLYGPSTAQEAAGHVDPKTTSKHYAKRMATVPAGMVKELEPWAPGNVVPMRGRKAG